MLVFSTDAAACNLWAQVAQEYDDAKGTISFGFVPRTLDEYATAWTPGSRVHKALHDATDTFQKNVDRQFKKLVVADITSYTDAIIEAFIAEFPLHAPWSESNAKNGNTSRPPADDRNLKKHFSIFVGGHEIVFKAHAVYNGWRQDWYKEGTRYSTTEVQKQCIRVGLKEYWKEPWKGKKPPAKLRMSAQIDAFLAKFRKRKPEPGERFEYRIPRPDGGYDTGSNLAKKWLENVRQSWHDDADKSRGSHDHPTTAEQKQRLRDGLKEKPWCWKDPEPRQTGVVVRGGIVGSPEALMDAQIPAIIALNLEVWPVRDTRTFEYTVGDVTRQARLGMWLRNVIVKWDTLTDAQQRLLESQPFWSTRRPPGKPKGTKRALSGVPKRTRTYSLENSDDDE